MQFWKVQKARGLMLFCLPLQNLRFQYKPKKNGDHPTMKPIPLIAYPIKNSSMTNCIVLDPFGGSGSTLIACEQTGRICRTIELDEKFCDVIVKRYIEQVGTTENVFIIRDGSKIPYEKLEACAEEK